jgi:prephenate dehydratase
MARRLAYLGPPGTYTEEAAQRYDPQATRIPFPTNAAVADATRAGVADEGVVPIENSLEGAVPDTLDLLIRETDLRIRRELVTPIEHCLLALPDTQPEAIRAIYSHPNALGQCREYLERRFPSAQTVASLSTVTAVEEMKASAAPAAAIAPRRAAQLYGVEVMATGIQDRANNVTRFVVLAHQDHKPTGADKTSICFAFDDDRPGLLYNAMREFAVRGINLVKVESRPTKESLGRYIFLVDLQGHREDGPVAEALEALGREASMLKVFGSYPQYRVV